VLLLFVTNIKVVEYLQNGVSVFENWFSSLDAQAKGLRISPPCKQPTVAVPTKYEVSIYAHAGCSFRALRARKSSL